MTKGVKDPSTFDALHVPDPLPPGPPPAPPVVSPDPVEEAPPAKRDSKPPGVPRDADTVELPGLPPVVDEPVEPPKRAKRDTDEHWPDVADRKATVRDKPPLKKDK